MGNMEKPYLVIPDVLTSNVEEVSEKIRLIKDYSDRLHIDIIDGVFADNLTIAPADLQQVDLSQVKFDLHLMVDDPTAWTEECVAISPHRIISHIERMGNQVAYVDWLKGYGDVGAGLALDLYTPISGLAKEVLSKIDVVLLMSVKAGESGQKFDKSVVDKVRELRKIYEGEILIDGGINPKTAREVVEVGATEVATNSYLWQGNDIEKQLESFYG